MTLTFMESLRLQIQIEEKLIQLKAKDSLYHYCKYMWNVIEPETPFKDGWHIEEICRHLEACTEFTIPKLIINMPPRHMKSIIACVMWPSWVWGKYPNRSFLFASHSEALAVRDSIKTRQLIESEKYAAVFKHDWSLLDDQNTKTVFSNSKNGTRKAIGVGTGVVGFGADYLVTDDPNDPREIHSEVHRETVKFWYDKVFSSRVNNPTQNCKVTIMQRLHEDDLSGHLLKEDVNKEIKNDHLVLSAELELNAEVKSKTSLHFKDPRTHEGELLWPNQWTYKSIRDLEASLGDEAPAQLQQIPRPLNGGLFPKENWQTYLSYPQCNQIVVFVDAAQKPGVSNDYSVFAVWGKNENSFFLLDLWRYKTTGPLLEQYTKNICAKWNPHAVVIEDKSAGSSLIQYLKLHTTLPVIPFDPLQRDKVVRASSATPTVSAGKCYLPEHITGVDDKGNKINLIKEFKKEHETFPKSKHDDMVDTTSMMVEYFNNRTVAAPRIRSL